MFRKLTIRKKLFLYVTVAFAVFTVFVLIFQNQREKEFRKRQLENTLDNITELTNNFIEEQNLINDGDFTLLDSLIVIFPQKNIRITIIDPKGDVLYDSEVIDFDNMKNHLHRPEVQESVVSDFGSNIRTSATTGKSYYYFSKFYSEYFIRTAVLYDIVITDFLQSEKLFMVYLLGLFLLILIILHIITKKFGRTITKLKEFAIKLNNEEVLDDLIIFPEDELGAVSTQIAEIYNKLDLANKNISIEKNKLYSHLQALNEGIAFFSSDKKKLLANNHFIQFINVISEKSTITAEDVFSIPELLPINNFINKQLADTNKSEEDAIQQYEINILKGEKYFNVQCVFFQDKCFEIVIKETTKLTKRKLIKQQMISNISHELKTPVATVMGYLETLKRNSIEKEIQEQFIDKAFNQAKHLSDLIEDISVLNKIEEAKEFYSFEEVNINDVVGEVHDDFKIEIDECYAKVKILFDQKIITNGNKSLLFSVFYNLFDNALKYGGENVNINLTNYLDDDNFYYFSFANTGNVIEETHFTRIFERFYRVDKGRSRKKGGTGLGLSIVKNAIEFHNGTITARNYKEGGVEFLFTIAKKS